MAVLPIRFRPDPVLRRKARKVTSIDDAIHRLVDDMIDTMRAVSGVGLAAPQVGVPLRVAVIELPDEEVITLINPEIVKRQGERIVIEACLSVPGYRGMVRRSAWVKVKAQDRDGNHIRIKGEELLAQALEHEINHLNGILYVDQVEGPDGLEKIQTEENSDGL